MSQPPGARPCEECPRRARSSVVRLGVPTGDSDYVVALAGNPNTGKGTVFNALTGLRQHAGNWPGKTIARAEGGVSFGGSKHKLVDLPGTYSLQSTSADEEMARDFILFGRPDVTVVVVDARPATQTAPRDGPAGAAESGPPPGARSVLELAGRLRWDAGLGTQDTLMESICANAGRMAARAVSQRGDGPRRDWDQIIDRLVTNRGTGFPIMVMLLTAVLWLTITGANVPSAMLADGPHRYCWPPSS